MPLGMTRSTFEQHRPPPGALRGHDAEGRPVPTYRYAAQAAAGPWSTAADVGRFVAFVMSPQAAPLGRAARATGGHWGEGLELTALRDGLQLAGHDGVNRGWHAYIGAVPARGWGIAVLTDGDGGGAVADAALRELVR